MLLRCSRHSSITSRIRQAQKSVFVRLQTTEAAHPPKYLVDPLDEHICRAVRKLALQGPTPVPTLYEQYRARSGWIRDDLILVSEERPASGRRVEFEDNNRSLADEIEFQGDGTLLIVHALLKPDHDLRSGNNSPKDEAHPDDIIEKLAICSGFALNTRAASGKAEPATKIPDDGAVILTCAHTLEEMHRYLARSPGESSTSLSFVLTSAGVPIAINEVLSSIPRSDLCVFKTEPTEKPLQTLPISLYPIPNGQPVAVHLFGSVLNPEGPEVRLNRRFRRSEVDEALQDDHATEKRIQSVRSWIGGKASRRWACGAMLGYRSYTGQEVEAGSTHTLPHLQTSPLPTPGSSGGPIVRLDTGTIVGMTSGTRMDNRVEGERGWGATAEGVFEMFALPGFIPASRRD